jgi:hypothetical protein
MVFSVESGAQDKLMVAFLIRQIASGTASES